MFHVRSCVDVEEEHILHVLCHGDRSLFRSVKTKEKKNRQQVGGGCSGGGLCGLPSPSGPWPFVINNVERVNSR